MIQDQSGSATPNGDANATADVAAGQTNNNDVAAPDATKNADGTPKEIAKTDKPDGITPEIQKYLDSQAAAARRAGEARGKQTKEEEIDAAKAETARLAAIEAGQHKQLYDTEVSQHNATKTTLSSTSAEFDKLKAALASKVPNPLDNYKRIVGENYDAMVEDAKTLAASFGNNAHNDPNTPPVVPNVGDGGKHDQTKDQGGKTTTADIDRNRGRYNVL